MKLTELEVRAAREIMRLERERETLLDSMRGVERHLKAIADSTPYKNLTFENIDHLGEAREIVARALCQHTPHQVIDGSARTFRICTKCGAVLDDLALR